MKFCNRCGNPLASEAAFCSACGSPVTTPVDSFTREREVLNTMDRMLKYERLAWKIAGHCFLWIGVTLSSMGLLLLSLDSAATTFLGLLYSMVFAFVYIPVGIIGLKAAENAQQYRDQLYFDVRPAAQRCGSVGMIVFSAFFNTIAMVFIIINFVHVKNNQSVINRIAAHQQEAGAVR